MVVNSAAHAGSIVAVRIERGGLTPLGFVLLGALLGALTGCAVGPTFHPPAAPAEQAYEQRQDAPLPRARGETPQRLVVGEELTADWWTLFHSSALDAVVKEALTGNPNLAAAKANLDAAQQIANAARGGLYPELDFGAAVSRQRQNYAAFGLTFPPTTFNTFSIGPTVSYSIDPFGKNRRLVEQRSAEADVERYQRDAAYLALTGNVVGDALRMAALRAEIEATAEVIAEDERTLALAEQRANVGITPDVDVAEAKAALATDRMAMPPLEQRLGVTRHALAALIGKTPAAWNPPDFSLTSLTLPSEIPLSLPSRLVHQRPDILAAEAALHAASAAIGVATAAAYPDITLTGSIQQMAAASLLAFPATIWSIAAGLSAPIFRGGALAAERRAAEAHYVSVAEGYRSTVLRSFAQVADTLDALRHDAALRIEAQAALAAANHALDLTQQNYAAGTIALLDVLAAQRARQHALIEATRAEAAGYVDTANLFLAMGGGWWRTPGYAPLPSETAHVSGVAKPVGGIRRGAAPDTTLIRR